MCPRFSFITFTCLPKMHAFNERSPETIVPKYVAQAIQKTSRQNARLVTFSEQNTLEQRKHNPLLHRDSIKIKHYFMALPGYLNRWLKVFYVRKNMLLHTLPVTNYWLTAPYKVRKLSVIMNNVPAMCTIWKRHKKGGVIMSITFSPSGKPVKCALD